MGDSEFSASTGSIPQEYFLLPSSSKFSRILANYKADIPPLFLSKLKKGVLPRYPSQGEVSKLRSLTRKSTRSVSSNALNAWKDSPADVVKLPDSRTQSHGDIFYTRGRLCKSLNRTKPEFDLSDPYNQRKVAELKEYSALHDPHCKTYFNSPIVLKHLKKQRLINDNGEVLCSFNEFNRYRSYLAAMYRDQVRRRLDDSAAMKELERGLKLAIVSKRTSQQGCKNKDRICQVRKSFVANSKSCKNFQKAESWNRNKGEVEKQVTRIGGTRAKSTLKHWNVFKARQNAERVEDYRKMSTVAKIASAETKNDYASATKYDKFVFLLS